MLTMLCLIGPLTCDCWLPSPDSFDLQQIAQMNCCASHSPVVIITFQVTCKSIWVLDIISSTEYRDAKNMYFLHRVFCCFKTFFVFFLWPLLSIFNAGFDSFNQTDTLNGHIKWVFNAVKRNTNIKSHYLHGRVQILKDTTATAPLFDCPNSVNT